MSEPRRGVSRRGLLGIFGAGFRELRDTAKSVEKPFVPPPAVAPAFPRLARPADEMRMGTCDAHGRLALDLRAAPLAVGASIRVDAVGFPVPVVLVRVNEMHFAACATACPADGSDVVWSAEADVLACPSCASWWRLDGEVVRGPAATDLRSFVVQEAEGDVRIFPE